LLLVDTTADVDQGVRDHFQSLFVYFEFKLSVELIRVIEYSSDFRRFCCLFVYGCLGTPKLLFATENFFAAPMAK
jgi:hypothetical protein